MLSFKQFFWLIITLFVMGMMSGCIHRPSMHHPHHLENTVVQQTIVPV